MNKLKEEMKKVFITTNKDILKKGRDLPRGLASFIVSGGMGVFQEWLEQNCEPPIHTLIHQFYETFSKISV